MKKTARKNTNRNLLKNTNRNSPTNVLSTDKLKIILDNEFVAEYLKKQEQEKENQAVIDLDESDSSVEFVCTKKASPKTRKITRIVNRMFDLAKENDELKVEIQSLKNIVHNQNMVNEPVSASASVNVVAAESNEPSTSANLADFDISFDEEWVNDMLDGVIAMDEIADVVCDEFN